VLKLLQDAEWTKWSNNAIAKHTMVSRGLVDDIRKELKAVHTCDSASMEKSSTEPRAATRTFIHPKTGKPTQMKTDGIGKRNRAAKPEKNTSARPEATLTPSESAKPAATVSQADSLIVPPPETEGFMRERPASGVRTFAAFCSANSATSVAVSILPNEVEEIRFSAARIYEWLDQFALAMDRVEGPKTARGGRKGPQRPGKSSVRQPTLSTNTSPESPDLFESFDR
jgi:hypothetical protein